MFTGKNTWKVIAAFIAFAALWTVVSTVKLRISKKTQSVETSLDDGEPPQDLAVTGVTLVNDISKGDKRIVATELVVGPIGNNSEYGKIGLNEGDNYKVERRKGA